MVRDTIYRHLYFKSYCVREGSSSNTTSSTLSIQYHSQVLRLTLLLPQVPRYRRLTTLDWIGPPPDLDTHVGGDVGIVNRDTIQQKGTLVLSFRVSGKRSERHKSNQVDVVEGRVTQTLDMTEVGPGPG